MSFIIGKSCVGCVDTACVDVCPVDCFYEGPNFLVINPDECIDCAVCIPECPANAIVAEEDIKDPNEKAYWLEVNTRLSANWVRITKKKQPLPDSEEWKDKPNKRNEIIE